MKNRLSSASLAGDRRSSFGLFGSLALHGLIVAGMLFTFSHTLDIVDQSAPVVPVDLVTLGAKTNVRAMVKAAPKIEPIKPEPSPPQPQQFQAPAVPQQSEDSAPPKPEPAPSEVVKTPPAIPKERPQEKPKQEKNKFDLDAVSALLNKVAPAPSRTNARVGNRNFRGFGDQTAMTADLTSMLESMIRPCWSPPVGAPHPEDLIVHFDVILNPDGSVARVTQLPGQSGPYFQAAAEAARRAIFTCQPYRLPTDRYTQWREIEDFEFDPRQMMGE